ncbi:(2Fe-2S) ferredoxin domain-containing protein [Streptomyces cremeus]|uniref:(2Fe-2S) ferredoxin domain-containing protein n=1 Tax=Streptomyces cremeus TaxID=66881 RepID=A0ABV5PJF1_STRCM
MATFRRIDCLDACERADAVVLRPCAEGRRAGGRPVRPGQVDGPGAAADTTARVADGGPGPADPPGVLDLCAFQPPRRVRAGLHDEQHPPGTAEPAR